VHARLLARRPPLPRTPLIPVTLLARRSLRAASLDCAALQHLMHIAGAFDDVEGFKALQAHAVAHCAAEFALEAASKWGLTAAGPAADAAAAGGGGGSGSEGGSGGGEDGQWRVPVILGGDFNATPGPKFDPMEVSERVRGRGWAGYH
jgi:hypothetical protein